jgi:hypothetical protein
MDYSVHMHTRATFDDTSVHGAQSAFAACWYSCLDLLDCPASTQQASLRSLVATLCRRYHQLCATACLVLCFLWVGFRVVFALVLEP